MLHIFETKKNECMHTVHVLLTSAINWTADHIFDIRFCRWREKTHKYTKTSVLVVATLHKVISYLLLSKYFTFLLCKLRINSTFLEFLTVNCQMKTSLGYRVHRCLLDFEKMRLLSLMFIKLLFYKQLTVYKTRCN